jgi:hypothetical protein
MLAQDILPSPLSIKPYLSLKDLFATSIDNEKKSVALTASASYDDIELIMYIEISFSRNDIRTNL